MYNINMEDSTYIFLIISNAVLLIGNIIQLAFKAKHFRSSCCGHRVVDLKNSLSADLRDLGGSTEIPRQYQNNNNIEDKKNNV